MQIFLLFTACCYSCIYSPIAANADESEVSHIHRNNTGHLHWDKSYNPDLDSSSSHWTHKHWKLQTAMCSKTHQNTDHHIRTEELSPAVRRRSNLRNTGTAETSLSLGGAEHCTREIMNQNHQMSVCLDVIVNFWTILMLLFSSWPWLSGS